MSYKFMDIFNRGLERKQNLNEGFVLMEDDDEDDVKVLNQDSLDRIRNKYKDEPWELKNSLLKQRFQRADEKHKGMDAKFKSDLETKRAIEQEKQKVKKLDPVGAAVMNVDQKDFSITAKKIKSDWTSLASAVCILNQLNRQDEREEKRVSKRDRIGTRSNIDGLFDLYVGICKSASETGDFDEGESILFYKDICVCRPEITEEFVKACFEKTKLNNEQLDPEYWREKAAGEYSTQIATSVNAAMKSYSVTFGWHVKRANYKYFVNSSLDDATVFPRDVLNNIKDVCNNFVKECISGNGKNQYYQKLKSIFDAFFDESRFDQEIDDFYNSNEFFSDDTTTAFDVLNS